MSDHIKSYLKHLHDHLVRNEKLTKHLITIESHRLYDLPSNMEKAFDIVTYFGLINEGESDLTKLFEGLSGQDGVDLISQHLLKNKNILYMINARNLEQVLHILAKENGGCLPNESLQIAKSHTEHIYRTKFFTIENTVFNDFEGTNYKPETEKCKPTSANILYHTPIVEPKE